MKILQFRDRETGGSNHGLVHNPPTPPPPRWIQSLVLRMRRKTEIPCVRSTLCSLGPMFPQPDIPSTRCSLGPMFPQTMFPLPVFPQPMFPLPDVPSTRCSLTTHTHKHTHTHMHTRTHIHTHTHTRTHTHARTRARARAQTRVKLDKRGLAMEREQMLQLASSFVIAVVSLNLQHWAEGTWG